MDVQLFFDDDDRVYLSSAPKCRPHNGITTDPPPHLISMGCEIDIKTGRSLSPPTVLRVSPTGRRIAEGPHIYKINGWYYLLTAEGGTEKEHHIVISRSKSPMGPYETSDYGHGINPVVYNGDDEHVTSTGHGDLFEGSDGRWWMVLLAVRPQENGVTPLLRETFLMPVEWTQDGWPRVREKVSSVIPADLPQRKNKQSVWEDQFESCE